MPGSEDFYDCIDPVETISMMMSFSPKKHSNDIKINELIDSSKSVDDETIRNSNS